jgi:hypothetical protein
MTASWIENAGCSIFPALLITHDTAAENQQLAFSQTAIPGGAEPLCLPESFYTALVRPVNLLRGAQ